jgi:hypothetical protein
MCVLCVCVKQVVLGVDCVVFDVLVFKKEFCDLTPGTLATIAWQSSLHLYRNRWPGFLEQV